jgi:copper chaperone CopZ
MAIGIPMYVCATASIPIAAAFIAAGFSPGAALVFLMTGPTTNAATIAVIWKTMGRKTSIIYVIAVAISALIFGYLLDLVYFKTGVSADAPLGTMLPMWFRSFCSVVFLAVLVFAYYHKPEIPELETTENNEKLKLKVTGMDCAHCSDSVRKVLMSLPGVEDASVDHTSGNVVIVGKNFNLDAIKKSIADLGYKVEE